MNELTIILITIFATFIGGFGSLYLKKGSAELHRHFWRQFKNYKLMFGLFLFGISSIVYVYALKFADLSLVYPITSFSYIWVSLLSVKILGEKMNSFKWLGISLIIIGVFLITR